MSLSPELPNLYVHCELVEGDYPEPGVISEGAIEDLVLLLNPAAILNKRVLCAGILRGYADWTSKAMKTKSVEHEILHRLSVDWEIQKTLSRFSGQGLGKRLLVTVSRGVSSYEERCWECDEEEIAAYYGVSEKERALPGGLTAAVMQRVAVADI